MKSDDELKKENPELYSIARKKGTERPFSGKYVNTKDDGMYHCSVCDAPLFSSDSKFDSRTGWPSFSNPALSESIELKEGISHRMKRTEVICKKCNAHLGHLFPDGPRKEDGSSNRFCINSVSLNLKKEKEG